MPLELSRQHGLSQVQIGLFALVGAMVAVAAPIASRLADAGHSQRAVYALDAASRGRLNALYMTSIFAGGAGGFAIASLLYAQTGWVGIVGPGSGLALVALVTTFLVHSRKRASVQL